MLRKQCWRRRILWWRQLLPTTRGREWVPACSGTRARWPWRCKGFGNKIRRCRRGYIVCRLCSLSNEFPVIGKNHQDPGGGIDGLRALDKLTVKDPQDLAVACNPRAFGKQVRGFSYPRTPRLPLYGEDQEDVAFVYALVGRTVVLWQQAGAQLYKHRGLAKCLRPDTLLDMECV